MLKSEYFEKEKILEEINMYWPGYIIGCLGPVLGIIYFVINYIKYGYGPFDIPYFTGFIVIFTIIPMFLIAGYLLNKKILMEREMEKLNNQLSERKKELVGSYVKIKESDELKSNFLMALSHELRTPLNAVLVFAGLLKNRVYGKINKHQEDSLEMILNSGNNLLSLIETLLDLSKIEAGEMELILSEYQLDDIVTETVNNMKDLAEKKELKIEVEGTPDVPPIYGDRNKVKYIITSLIENAIKFTDEGSISIKYKCNADFFSFIVKDTGIGMKDEDSERIFKEFVQLDGSSTREYGGVGLGLTIAKKFIELHQGDIEVKSSFGSGTKFKVRLPIRYNPPSEN